MKRQRNIILGLMVALGLAISGLAMSPASAHVGSWAHNWTEHIKPKADKRYYTKTKSNTLYYQKAQADNRYQRQTMPPGGTESGVWGTAGGVGSYGAAPIDFDSPLPGAVATHYLTTGTTSAECPGSGQAAPGHLCVYETWTNAMTFTAFTDTTIQGTIAYLTSTNVSGNARGTWTVRAPLTAPARLAPQGALPRTLGR